MIRFSAVSTAALFFCLAAAPAAAEAPQTTSSVAAPAGPAVQAAVKVSAAPALSQQKAEDKIVIGSEVTGFQPQLHKTLQALLVVSCLVLLGFGAYNKFGAKFLGRKTPESQMISILSRHPFGPRSALLVADIAGQRFLLAHTNDDLRMLSRLQAPVPQTNALNDLLESAENNKIAAVDILKLASNR